MNQPAKILQLEPTFTQKDAQTYELNFGLASVQIKNDGSIILKNPHAHLELCPDGKININGQNIYLNSHL